MASSLIGKLEGSVEIDAPPKAFHEMWFHRPHHISNACPDKVQACDLHQGDWGKQGSVVCFSYYHDGKARIAKNLVQAADPRTNSITWKVLEGDVLEEYKSFLGACSASAKPNGKGSIVRWVFEYEKLHEGIPPPEQLRAFLLGLSKDMGSHLAQAQA